MFANRTPPKTLAFLLAATCALAACDRDNLFEPDEEVTVAPSDAGLFQAGNLKVMTRNLFVGAPVELIYEPGANIPEAAATLWAWVQDTNFEERAGAIADEIDHARPHVIGLQEVSVFTIVRPCPPGPPFGCPDVGVTPAPVDQLHFEEVLLAELEARGLGYSVASRSTNFAGAVPMLDYQSPSYLSLITLEDFDVVLVRDDVAWTNGQNDIFETNLEVSLAGLSLEIYRGWASADVTVDGFEFRFLTTHLEPREFDPSIQVAQADQVIETVTNWTLPGGQLPTIVTGDINSAPSDPGGSTPYRNFLKAGFSDIQGPIWAEATCCQDESLRLPSQLDRRVDLILFHGDFGGSPTFAIRTGYRESDRTVSGLWPSDHAGVVAWRSLPRDIAIQ